MTTLIKPLRPSFVAVRLRTVEPDTWLEDAMDEVIAAGQVKWRSPRKYFRASGAGDGCPRSLTINAFGYQKIFEPRTLRIFRMGIKVEEGVIADLESVQKMLGAIEVRSTQLSVESEYPPMKGRMDVLIAKMPSGEELVGEVKSINQNGFDRLPKVSSRPEANTMAIWHHNRGHLCQVTVYAERKGAKAAFLLYECKNNSARKLYWLTVDYKLIQEIFDFHEAAWEYLEKDQVAPVPEEREPTRSNDSLCKGCHLRYLCVALPVGAVDYNVLIAKDKELRGE